MEAKWRYPYQHSPAVRRGCQRRGVAGEPRPPRRCRDCATTPRGTAMPPSRSQAAQIAHDTLDILAAGQYTTPTGKTVVIRDQLDAAVRGTVTYPPDAPLPKVARSGRTTRFEV